MKYQNGNAEIEIQYDGTRIIKYEGDLKLDYPLNIDIRVSTRCSFGYNPKTNSAFCDFCHESARTDGKECDYNVLMNKLEGLPKGIELAIGANYISMDLVNFLKYCFHKEYICNLTINQGHLRRDLEPLKYLIAKQYIKGLGVSYRGSLHWDIPQEILDYKNTVLHVIAGIDNIYDVIILPVKKILVLGEKSFGFNEGKVDLTSQSHKEWYRYVSVFFDKFEVVSFDNLALEQLNIKRFLIEKDWDTFYQGEHSMYINAVEGYFSPSSRNSQKTDWNDTNIKTYFNTYRSI